MNILKPCALSYQINLCKHNYCIYYVCNKTSTELCEDQQFDHLGEERIPLNQLEFISNIYEEMPVRCFHSLGLQGNQNTVQFLQGILMWGWTTWKWISPKVHFSEINFKSAVHTFSVLNTGNTGNTQQFGNICGERKQVTSFMSKTFHKYFPSTDIVWPAELQYKSVYLWDI